MIRRIVIFVCLFLVMVWAPSAQEANINSLPTLTEIQRLQVLNAVKDVELWTLKLQQATSELEKARMAFQTLLTAVTPIGYQINDRLELVKIPDLPKPAAKP